jgi:NAD(P)H dehydrogenase (quinone)
MFDIIRTSGVCMNTLIVVAHPEPQSFNMAMVAAARDALAATGQEVRILDLYADGFDPVLRREQFPTRKNPSVFEPMVEQAHQAQLAAVAPDVARSQALLRWADNVILQFPLWWWSLPAAMKGWIDRVFSAGFAYGGSDLEGRRAMLLVSAETKSERFASGAPNHPLEHIERGMLKFSGFQVLPAFVAADIHDLAPAERSTTLQNLSQHVRLHFNG